jgi:hypothetical protein
VQERLARIFDDRWLDTRISESCVVMHGESLALRLGSRGLDVAE